MRSWASAAIALEVHTRRRKGRKSVCPAQKLMVDKALQRALEQLAVVSVKVCSFTRCNISNTFEK